MLNFLLKNDRLIIVVAPLIMVVGVVAKIITGIEPLRADSAFHLGFIQSWPAWLNYALGGIFALITGLKANQTIQSLGILGRISNLPNLFIVLLFFMLPEESNFFYLWTIFFLQLAILRWVEQIPDEQKKLSVFVFNASLIVGLLTLLEAWSVLYFFLVIQSLAAVGMITLRRFIIGLLGLLIPVYFYNAFLFIGFNELYFPSFDLALLGVLLPFDKQSMMAVIMIVFMLLMALTSLYGSSGSSTLRVRRRWMIVVTFMFISAFIVLNMGYVDMAIFIVFPSSIVLSKALITIKNQRVGSIYFLVFLLIIFFYNT